MFIQSRANERIKAISLLKDKKERTKTNSYIVEGYKMVREAFESGQDVKLLVATVDAIDKLQIDFSNTLTVSDSVFSYLSDCKTPQGVLAVIAKNCHTTENFDKCVFLDGISDPGNLGTILRTMVALDIKDIFLADCCDAYAPKVIRSSMSGIYSVNIREGSREEMLKAIGDIPIIVADMNGENLFEFQPPKRFCLVIGNEANGVSELLKTNANYTVSLPMSDKIESLNAGVSLSVILYELTLGKSRIVNKEK